MKPTIGQHLLAAVIAHRMGIAPDRALKLYVCVHGYEIDPSWEMLGQALLRAEPGQGVPENLSLALGPQLVPTKPENSPA
ncbi:MAG: hypothetical protein WBF09_08885 [Candidatus Acidiferrum sp.]